MFVKQVTIYLDVDTATQVYEVVYERRQVSYSREPIWKCYTVAEFNYVI